MEDQSPGSQFDIRAICFDWGGTLMSEVGPSDIPMALWPDIRVIDGAGDTLAALHENFTLCIATNATMSHRPMVERALARGGLLPYFSHIFTDTDLGVRKESPAFWQAATSRLGVNPYELAMVGDTLEPDVLAPMAFGAFAVWFNERGSRQLSKRDIPTVSRLTDVVSLIKNVSRSHRT